VSHNGDWQELEATAGTGKGENEWLRVTIQWDESQSAADLEVTLCNLTLPDTTSNCASSGADNDIDGTFTNPPNLLRFGALDTVGVYVDNVQIYGESGL